MSPVHQLQRFDLPLDVEAFLKTHRDCPDDPALLQELWQLVHPTAIWRDAIIGANDGWQLVLGRADKPLLTVDSLPSAAHSWLSRGSWGPMVSASMVTRLHWAMPLAT